MQRSTPTYSNNTSKNCRSYYVFGVTLNGRDFTSEDYKFGFGQMEKDDEVKGSGNSYDFGARIYDSRLGRWLSIDNLHAKYPWLSPYAFVNNNPNTNKEKDGNDFEVVIDHEAKTITIKATYYVKTGDCDAYDRSETALGFWNDQSGQFQYKVGKGNDAIYYDINVQLHTLESDNPRQDADIMSPGEIINSGITSDGIAFEEYGNSEPNYANSFIQESREDFNTRKTDLKLKENVDGFCEDGQYIHIPIDIDSDEAISHEIGHSLGLDHFQGTLMNKTTDGITPIVRTTMMATMLGLAKITKNYPEDGAAEHVRTKVTHTGDKPENFDKGKVTTKD